MITITESSVVINRVNVYRHTKLAGVYADNIVVRPAQVQYRIGDLVDDGALEVLAVNIPEIEGREMAKKTPPHARLSVYFNNAVLHNKKISIQILRTELLNLVEALRAGHGPLVIPMPTEGRTGPEVILLNTLYDAWSPRREKFDYEALKHGFERACDLIVLTLGLEGLSVS